MTTHTTIPKVSRIEVVSTSARRRWTLEEKRRIVAESYGGRGEVSATARRHGLSGGQLFTWRRLAREGRLGDEAAALVPVKIAVLTAERPTAPDGDHHDETITPAKVSTSTGSIVIELRHGRCIRVDRDFDADALRRVIDVLDRRR